VTDRSAPDRAQDPASRPATRIRVFGVTALIALTADIVSKVLVVAHIKPEDRGVRLFGGAVYLVQARNSGAAFSVGTGATVMLTAISVVVAIIIIRAARRLTSTWWAVSLGLVLGGALGNLVDRFLRAPAPGKGHVVDWISLFANDGHVWPIFNLADSCIVVGGAIAVVLSVCGIDFYGKRNPFEKDNAKDAETGRGAAGEPVDDSGASASQPAASSVGTAANPGAVPVQDAPVDATASEGEGEPAPASTDSESAVVRRAQDSHG
jgi:signal peptidase II